MDKSLSELATEAQAKHDAYTAARALSNQKAQEAADAATAADAAHVEAKTALDALIAAAQAEEQD